MHLLSQYKLLIKSPSKPPNADCSALSNLQATSWQQTVFRYILQLPGIRVNFPRTSSLHTPITVKFSDSKLMPFSYLNPYNVTSLHGVSINLEQCQSFSQISRRQHNRHYFFIGFTRIPSTLTHFIRSCYINKRRNWSFDAFVTEKT